MQRRNGRRQTVKADVSVSLTPCPTCIFKRAALLPAATTAACQLQKETVTHRKCTHGWPMRGNKAQDTVARSVVTDGLRN